MSTNRTRHWIPTFIRKRVLWKLVTGNLFVVVIVLVVAFYTVDRGTARLLDDLMQRYNIEPVVPTRMFLESSLYNLGIGGGLALLIGVTVNYLQNRTWLRSLQDIRDAAMNIAMGDYQQVNVASEDEVGQLAQAMNQMSASLLQLEAQRRQLLMDVAHELRTPLTSVKGYLTGIREGVIQADTFALTTLEREVGRLQTLVDSIHQLNTMEYGAVQIDLEIVDIIELTKEMWSLFEHRLSERGLTANLGLIAVDSSPVFVRGSRDLLAQVFYNVLENVWRYAAPGGEVALNVSIEFAAPPNQQTVAVSIRNTLAERAHIDVSKIFDRFYRADPSRARATGGIGIGLSIAKQIINTHGGDIHATMSNIDFTLNFRLPIALPYRTIQPDI